VLIKICCADKAQRSCKPTILKKEKWVKNNTPKTFEILCTEFENQKWEINYTGYAGTSLEEGFTDSN
jgi:hypothetical protein